MAAHTVGKIGRQLTEFTSSMSKRLWQRAPSRANSDAQQDASNDEEHWTAWRPVDEQEENAENGAPDGGNDAIANSIGAGAGAGNGAGQSQTRVTGSDAVAGVTVSNTANVDSELQFAQNQRKRLIFTVIMVVLQPRGYLSVRDLGHLAGVCTDWRLSFEHDSVWLPLLCQAMSWPASRVLALAGDTEHLRIVGAEDGWTTIEREDDDKDDYAANRDQDDSGAGGAGAGAGAGAGRTNTEPTTGSNGLPSEALVADEILANLSLGARSSGRDSGRYSGSRPCSLDTEGFVFIDSEEGIVCGNDDVVADGDGGDNNDDVDDDVLGDDSASPCVLTRRRLMLLYRDMTGTHTCLRPECGMTFTADSTHGCTGHTGKKYFERRGTFGSKAFWSCCDRPCGGDEALDGVHGCDTVTYHLVKFSPETLEAVSASAKFKNGAMLGIEATANATVGLARSMTGSALLATYIVGPRLVATGAAAMVGVASPVVIGASIALGVVGTASVVVSEAAKRKRRARQQRRREAALDTLQFQV